MVRITEEQSREMRQEFLQLYNYWLRKLGCKEIGFEEPKAMFIMFDFDCDCGAATMLGGVNPNRVIQALDEQIKYVIRDAGIVTTEIK